MDTNQHELNDSKLILKNEVFQIVGAAIKVLNGLGHGLFCDSCPFVVQNN